MRGTTAITTVLGASQWCAAASKNSCSCEARLQGGGRAQYGWRWGGARGQRSVPLAVPPALFAAPTAPQPSPQLAAACKPEGQGALQLAAEKTEG